jgi:Xaa-Pro aminopeptidase
MALGKATYRNDFNLFEIPDPPFRVDVAFDNVANFGALAGVYNHASTDFDEKRDMLIMLCNLWENRCSYASDLTRLFHIWL